MESGFMNGAEVIIIRQNRWIRQFWKLGAVSPATAVEPDSIKGSGSWLFGRMVKKGVFVSTSGGKLYMDEVAAGAFKRWRRWRVFWGVLIILVTVILFLTLRAG